MQWRGFSYLLLNEWNCLCNRHDCLRDGVSKERLRKWRNGTKHCNILLSWFNLFYFSPWLELDDFQGPFKPKSFYEMIPWWNEVWCWLELALKLGEPSLSVIYFIILVVSHLRSCRETCTDSGMPCCGLWAICEVPSPHPHLRWSTKEVWSSCLVYFGS